MGKSSLDEERLAEIEDCSRKNKCVFVGRWRCQLRHAVGDGDHALGASAELVIGASGQVDVVGVLAGGAEVGNSDGDGGAIVVGDVDGVATRVAVLVEVRVDSGDHGAVRVVVAACTGVALLEVKGNFTGGATATLVASTVVAAVVAGVLRRLGRRSRGRLFGRRLGLRRGGLCLFRGSRGRLLGRLLLLLLLLGRLLLLLLSIVLPLLLVAVVGRGLLVVTAPVTRVVAAFILTVLIVVATLVLSLGVARRRRGSCALLAVNSSIVDTVGLADLEVVAVVIDSRVHGKELVDVEALGGALDKAEADFASRDGVPGSATVLVRAIHDIVRTSGGVLVGHGVLAANKDRSSRLRSHAALVELSALESRSVSALVGGMARRASGHRGDKSGGSEKNRGLHVVYWCVE